MTLRALMFGSTGQVARELRAISNPSFEIIALDRKSADFCDPDRCVRACEEHDVDAIIIAAAYTAVDAAEQDEEHARLVNATTPSKIAAVAADRNIALVHLSTDYVFDGTANTPYREDDPPRPLNIYGRTKLEGELALMNSGGTGAILRTSWVFAAHGRNFVRTMLRLGAERDRLAIVADQIGGPTSAPAIARAVHVVTARAVADRMPLDLYHFQGAPAVSWAEFAEAIFSCHARTDANKPHIEHIVTADYPTPARRPLMGVLDCRRIFDVFGISQPDWRSDLEDVVAQTGAL